MFNLGRVFCSIMDKHEFGWHKQNLERIAKYLDSSCPYAIGLISIAIEH